MKVGIDVFGCYFTPEENIVGANLTRNEFSNDTVIVLICDQRLTWKNSSEMNMNKFDFESIHATKIIGMDDHPTRAINQKSNTSISEMNSPCVTSTFSTIDEFTEDIVLKEAEGIYALMRKNCIHDEYFDRFNHENHDGTSISGKKGNVFIDQSVSKDIAVKNMIINANNVGSSGLTFKLNKVFN